MQRFVVLEHAFAELPHAVLKVREHQQLSDDPAPGLCVAEPVGVDGAVEPAAGQLVKLARVEASLAEPGVRVRAIVRDQLLHVVGATPAVEARPLAQGAELEAVAGADLRAAVAG